MDIYARKSRWKWYLAVAGLVIVAISVLFTNYLTSKLAREEQNKVEQWVFALSQVNSTDSMLTDNADVLEDNCDYTLHYLILQANTTIPVILENDRGGIDAAVNFGTEKDQDQAFLKEELAAMKRSGVKPLEGVEGVKIYFKKSRLLQLLELFPILQLILIAVFIGVGYLAFSNARRAEQNQVWVGMAKETAHQLGTPISAIIGWIDHLKDLKGGDKETIDVMEELRSDVTKLELIADRFSKIGSAPELQPVNIFEELEKSRIYMSRRAPRKVEFDFPGLDKPPLIIRINAHLFHWVIENLLRNALDAMDGKGKITVRVNESSDFVEIAVSDTGKGIPPSKFKTIFEPGFTTKTRGWGLGLSLAKRIVEQYHNGKIFVKSSEPEKETTFVIRLPK